MAARTATRKKAAAKPQVTEPEPEELDEEELEEVEETVESETPAKTSKGRPQVEFGIRQVCDLILQKHGKEVTPRELRVLARKLARDDSGRIDREIVAGNRAQYSWSGPKDPEVVALVEAYAAGEGEEEKRAKLAALKEKAAEKRAAQPKKTTTKKAAKKADPVEELDDEDDELDLDDDE
jgi:hypothetical protein